MPKATLPEKLYVGARNDWPFIIDKPPRPSTDAINPNQHVNTVAWMSGTDGKAALREANLMVSSRNACVSINNENPELVPPEVPEMVRLLSEMVRNRTLPECEAMLQSLEDYDKPFEEAAELLNRIDTKGDGDG